MIDRWREYKDYIQYEKNLPGHRMNEVPYIPHYLLSSEHNALIYTLEGNDDYPKDILDEPEAHLYKDRNGKVWDLWDFIDSLKVYRVEPFHIVLFSKEDELFMGIVGTGTASGEKYRIPSRIEEGMYIAARDEDEAKRIAYERIVNYIQPISSSHWGYGYPIPEEPLKMSEAENGTDQLRGLEFVEGLPRDYVYRYKSRGLPEDMVRYIRNDARSYFRLLEDFARKFSKEYMLRPLSKKVQEMFDVSHAYPDDAWNPQAWSIDKIDGNAFFCEETLDTVKDSIYRHFVQFGKKQQESLA